MARAAGLRALPSVAVQNIAGGKQVGNLGDFWGLWLDVVGSLDLHVGLHCTPLQKTVFNAHHQL